MNIAHRTHILNLSSKIRELKDNSKAVVAELNRTGNNDFISTYKEVVNQEIGVYMKEIVEVLK